MYMCANEAKFWRLWALPAWFSECLNVKKLTSRLIMFDMIIKCIKCSDLDTFKATVGTKVRRNLKVLLHYLGLHSFGWGKVIASFLSRIELTFFWWRKRNVGKLNWFFVHLLSWLRLTHKHCLLCQGSQQL